MIPAFQTGEPRNARLSILPENVSNKIIETRRELIDALEGIKKGLSAEDIKKIYFTGE